LCDTSVVTGAEFLRKVKKLAERTAREMRFVAARGKGSHGGRLYLGFAFTTVKDPKKEIGPGLLLRMCKDLGINVRDL
jgi:predicted RNA binding protein YcfA (HicA-like mRNA interferase family)